MQIAALSYLVLCAGVIVFQICLVAGAPWGHLTQGGMHSGTLSAGGRLMAGFSILILLGMAAAVASAAHLWLPGLPTWCIWTAVAVQALSTVLNWITPSQPERRLWGPVTSLMLLLALIVVLG